MKEATGEASNTVIVVILIAAILAVAVIVVNLLSGGVSDTANDLTSSGTATNDSVTKGIETKK